MAERFIRASHLRSLLPAVLLLAPALAVATILVGAFTGAERPAGSDGGVAPAQAATKSGGRAGRANTITIGWVGDITPGSQYGLPGNGGASLFANVQDTLRACILHPETRTEHLATLVAEVVVAARILAAAG